MTTELLKKLELYIKRNYEPKDFKIFSSRKIGRVDSDVSELLAENIFAVDEPFNMKLLKFIDASGKTDAQIYKKAGIDRRHFSKIRSSSDYIPQKKTIVALIIALELSLEDAEHLLDSAGYALSASYLFDVIVRFFFVINKV